MLFSNNYISFCIPLLGLYLVNPESNNAFLLKKWPKNAYFSRLLFTKLIIFLCSRWNNSTSETVLLRLLNFWNSETYLTKIPHPVQVREPPKVKKSKIRVARKLDLIGPNWVYSFSSFIRLYQTRIVRPILFSISFNLLDRVI